MEADIKRPNDKLTVNFRGSPRELFMSYLRLNSCLRIAGDLERIAYMTIDPDMSENILRVLLAEGAGPGAMFEFELGENDLTADDVERILDWTQEHLNFFVVKRLKGLGKTAEELKPLDQDLKAFAGGSQASS